jgi:hypothetical protein
MNVVENQRSWLSWRAVARRPVAGLAMAALVLSLAVPAVGAFLPPRATAPRPINAQVGPCRDAQVAATGPDRLTLGWTVADGPGTGVWTRTRLNYVFLPPVRLADAGTTRPRDLVMAYDARGRLHLAWTAVKADRRVTMHARIDQPDRPSSMPAAISDTTTTATAGLDGVLQPGDADLPCLATDDKGGALVAWEQAQGAGFAARAARVAPDGSIQDLGRVAGESLSGLNPRILTVDPPRVALDEVGQFVNSLRVDQWDAKLGAWTRSPWEARARLFEPHGQVQLFAAPSGDAVIGCWQQAASDGARGLGVGRARMAGDEPLALGLFDRPAGQHGSPSLSGSKPMTLAWQVFGTDGQAVVIAPLTDDGPSTGTRLSLPSERFASTPSHATVGDWSAVAWIDDARDGGDGNLYFAEVAWLIQ